MKKIITLVTLIFAFGQMSFGQAYPSSSKLMSKFKAEFDFANFKTKNSLKETIILSVCNPAIVKYDNKIWHESRSTVMIQHPNMYKSWPNDVLKGYVKIITPKNNFGEVITATFTIEYNRSKADYDGSLTLLNSWVFKEVYLKEMKVSPMPLTSEVIDPSLLTFVLNDMKFSKDLNSKIVRINKVYWNKKGAVHSRDGLTTTSYNSYRLLNASLWVVPVEIEAILQYKKYKEVITEKVNIKAQVTIKRNESGEWFVYYASDVTSFNRKDYPNPNNERYGALEFYSGKEIYQNFMPNKFRANTEEGKVAYGKEIHDLLMSFTYDLKTKDEVIKEINKHTWNNNLSFATSIWKAMYNYSAIQITLSNVDYTGGHNGIKKGDEDNSRLMSGCIVKYSANRDLDKGEIKVLKKKYGPDYLKYWNKALDNVQVRFEYTVVYEKSKWSIKQLRFNKI